MTSPEILDEWTALVCAELDLDPASVPITELLNAAKEVAHGVARPAAPLTTFLLGLAVGRATSLGLPAAAAAEAAVTSVRALAAEWVATHDAEPER